VSTFLGEFRFQVDEPEFSIAYSSGSVAIGIKDGDALLSVVFHPNSAMKLLLELREALQDLHGEDLGEQND